MILKAHLLRFGAILILPAILAACAASSDHMAGAGGAARMQQEVSSPAPKPAPPPKLTPAPVPAAVPPKAAPVFAPAFVGEGANTRPARPPLARRAATKSRAPASHPEPPARPEVLAAAADPSEPSSSATGAAPLQRMAPSAFHIPSPITLSQSVVAQLHIDPGKDLETVRAALSAATAGRPGELQAQMVEVAKHMRAELKSDEKVLRIHATSPPDQSVKTGETTVWTWSVTGLEPGNHELTVTLLKLLPDGEKAVPTPVYKVVVKVPEAGLLDRFIAFVKKMADLVSALDALIAAVLALIAAAGVAWKKKRKSGKGGAGGSHKNGVRS